MSIKLLYFFPHNPYPARSGAHQRCLAVLKSLKDLGCQITFMSAIHTSETTWEQSSIETLKQNWVEDVLIYKFNFLEQKLDPWTRHYYRLTRTEIPLSSLKNTPLGMRRWFGKIVSKIQPDIIFMNYIYWDKLILNRKETSGIRTILDSHDLVTLNFAMQNAISSNLQSLDFPIDRLDEEMLKENFFEGLNLEASPEEFSIFDHYDYTIVINDKEAELVKEKTLSTQISYIPVLQSVVNMENQYDGFPVFATGPNLFNLQGYFYFVQRVLPQILARDSGFCLRVTGSCCKQVTPTEGIDLLGYVPNLSDIYGTAKFAICPVFGGTGQQIKIVEAMAHGLPVVTTRFAGERSPIIHGENGFIANDVVEFADYVLALWKNRSFCQELGINAKATISNSFSHERLVKDLASII